MIHTDPDTEIPIVSDEGEEVDVTYNFTNTRVETYAYNAAGQLETISINEATPEVVYDGPLGQPIGHETGTGTVEVTPPSGPGTVRSSFEYDFMGRLTKQIDYAENGTTEIFYRDVHYNGKGQVIRDWSETRRGDCLLYTSPSPRDLSTSRMPSSA